MLSETAGTEEIRITESKDAAMSGNSKTTATVERGAEAKNGF